MAIDSNFWKRDFLYQTLPGWKCPRCLQGALAFKNQTTVVVREVPDEPTHNEYIKQLEFICTQGSCRKPTVCIGEMYVLPVHCRSDEDPAWNENDEDSANELDTWFLPHYFLPSLLVFDPPNQTPDCVTKSLKESFRLYFASPRAALNLLRQSLELLIDHLDPNQRKTRSLDKKIQKLQKNIISKSNKQALLAIKWCGNAGSHSSDKPIKHEQVLDAYQIFDSILTDLYITPNIKATVKAINSNKGYAKT